MLLVELKVKVVESGFSTISVHQKNVKVLKNDIMVIAPSTDNPNMIQFVESESKRTRFFKEEQQQHQKQLQIGDEISIKKNLGKILSYVPLISVITVRPFTAPLPQFVATTTGDLTVKATFHDDRNNQKFVSKTYKVQVHIIFKSSQIIRDQFHSFWNQMRQVIS